MLFDKKGKLFGKISIVDILIIVIIIALAGGVYYKFGRSGTVTAFTKTDKVQIQFYQESVPKYVMKSIKVGDVATDRVQNVSFGKITKIETKADVDYNANSEGILTYSSRPDYCSAIITVEGQGIYSPTGTKFGGVEYYVNKPSVETRFGQSFLYAKIMAINKVKE